MAKQGGFDLWERVVNTKKFESDSEREDLYEAEKKLKSLPAKLPADLARRVYATFLRQAPYKLWGSLVKVRDAHVDVAIEVLSESEDIQACFLCAAFEAGGADDLRLASKYLGFVDKSTNVPGMLKRLHKFFDPLAPGQGDGFYAASQIVLAREEKPSLTEILHFWAILWLFLYTTEDKAKIEKVREWAGSWDDANLYEKTFTSVHSF